MNDEFSIISFGVLVYTLLAHSRLKLLLLVAQLDDCAIAAAVSTVNVTTRFTMVLFHHDGREASLTLIASIHRGLVDQFTARSDIHRLFDSCARRVQPSILLQLH